MTFLPVASSALLAVSALLSPIDATAPSDQRITSPEALAAMIARVTSPQTSATPGGHAPQFVPSFSRQTKLSCAMCHNGFPQLTAFGRMFKLNGYTMTGLPTITDQKDSTHKTLELQPVAPLSVMALISNTSVAKAVEGSQRSTAQFPQQVSLFAASALSPRAGIFAQFTYEDQSGSFGIDNVDIRYANHTSISDRDVLFGVTLHNNPTVQDVWNTTPAWGYPFTSSAVAPSPASATLIEGALSQNVLGLGAYALYDGLVYAEVTGYTSAPQGAKLPADASATETTHGMAPYWRVALQHTIGETYLMVGTFGMAAKLFPTGISGLTNRYRDIGVDAQLERKVGKGTLIGRASFINESQTNVASFSASPAEAENPTATLKSMKVNATYVASPITSFSAGIFGVSGSHDGLLYAEGDVTGSAAGKPDSQGTMLEWTHSPWLNTRIGAQYVMYSKFNGRSTSYDVASGGRNARDNNTLYLYLWLAY